MSLNDELQAKLRARKPQVLTCEATITIMPNGEKYISLIDPSNNAIMMWKNDGTKWFQVKSADIADFMKYISDKS